MKQLLVLLVSLALVAPPIATGQTILPYVEGTFFANDGSPLSSGYICTTISGTTTNLATYPTLADAIAGTNANPNPVHLDSSGRANIFLGTGLYRIVILNTTGQGSSSCNGTPTGSAIKTIDGIGGASTQLIIPNINNIRYCNAFTGADIGAKIAACIADLPSTGGVADARGIVSGSMTTAVTISKAHVNLLLGGPFSATAGFTITAGNVEIDGNCAQATAITYAPSAGGTFLKWSNGASEIFFGGTRCLNILGTNAETKIGIELSDTSNVSVDRTWINLSGSTNDNEGIRLEGRESTYISGSYVQADIPLHVKDNPNSTIDCDFLNLSNNEWIGPTTGTPAATILIDTGVNVTRWNSIHNAYIGGAGLQQIDTTTAQISEEMNIIGDYCEQQPVAASYCIDIERNSLFYNINIVGLRVPSTTNGVKLTSSRNINVSNFLYDGTATAFNLDSSVDNVHLDSVTLTSASATATLNATHMDGCYYQIGASKPKVCFSEYLTVANGIIGVTTNSNAGTGIVGEYVSSELPSGMAVSLSTGTAASITSISLTAGDWDVSGVVQYTTAAGTSITQLAQGSGASNTCLAQPALTMFAPGTFSYQFNAAEVPGVGQIAIPFPTNRVSVAITTTVCLQTRAAFTADTLSAYGFISARRVR